MTKLVAETIIELAQRGIKNPTTLHMTTIKEFKSDPIARENVASLSEQQKQPPRVYKHD